MTANVAESPFAILTNHFVLKTFAFVIVLFAVGFAASRLLDPTEAFVSLLIGMTWSLAALICLVGGFIIAGSILGRLWRGRRSSG